MLYIYTHKVSAGAALLSGIMLLKTQLSGEKPQTERGDAVRNVYKAARGRTAEDEGAPRALCGLSGRAEIRIRTRPQRFGLDSEVELEVDIPWAYIHTKRQITVMSCQQPQLRAGRQVAADLHRGNYTVKHNALTCLTFLLCFLKSSCYANNTFMFILLFRGRVE